jgi:hypothetical protein
MSQGLLGFQYEVEKKECGLTAFAGLPVYLEFAHVMGLMGHLKSRLEIKDDDDGWSCDRVIMGLVLLNLAGGDCVDDLRILESDEGFCRVFRDIEGSGLPRKVRRAKVRQLNRTLGILPSPSTVFRTLRMFHDPSQESLRESGKAFIPSSNECLRSLISVSKDFIAGVQRRSPERAATLDMDATLVETNKKDASHCYKGYKAYQPFNTYWAEQELIVHSEFRDGNVPAGFEELRVFKEAIGSLPDGVEKVLLRSDTAGYQQDLLMYCAEAKNKRFGVIEFAIGADVNPEFKKAVSEVSDNDWISLGDFQEYAEVCFVPNWMARKKHGPCYRYIAVRERLKQQVLPGMEDQLNFPFQTMDMGPTRYKLTAIITNRDIPGDDLIKWYRQRCGKSEEAHSIMKEDLAGGKLLSGLFGANAAWWQIMILAFNLNSAMKRLVLGGSWVTRRLKAIRFRLINLPGRVVKHAGNLIIRLCGANPLNNMLIEVRRRILELCETG